MKIVHVIGAGLAGVEASYQLSKRGFQVHLYEMKPHKKSPAHHSDDFAELVCSNSLRSDSNENAVGILKTELRMMDSIVMKIADETRVPAGSALAVDRLLFSKRITETIRSIPNIIIHHEEVTTLFDEPTIIATGPLTSEGLFEHIRLLTGEERLYFFDAAAPIIEFDSINMEIAYFKSRYDKGEATYLNCPFTKEEYEHWVNEVIQAQCVVPKDFELKVFEGCMPFEEMAKRGKETLLYGPMKPVGLRKPNGEKPYAVVQLRQDNLQKTLYNIVGFQTHLTFPEQKRLIQMIPGLEKANIVRYGVMHRNTFLNAPAILNAGYQMKDYPHLFVAGQFAGVEGYVESVGSGLVAAINMARYLNGLPIQPFPIETALGCQAHYLAHAEISQFQPMNINFGIFTPLEHDVHKKERKRQYYERSIQALERAIGSGLFEK